MKRRAKRAMLLLAAAVLAGAWLVAGYLTREPAEAEAEAALAQEEGYDLSIGTQKDMTALSWAWEGETVNLRRDARGQWADADDPACPIDGTSAGILARAAAAVRADRRIENVTAFEQYGLDEPGLIVMAAAGEQIVTYEVGNRTLTGEYYLRVDHGSEVYLEDGGLASAFRTQRTALLATESLPDDVARVTRLIVETAAQSYTLSLAPDGAGWERTDTPEPEPLETARVEALCTLLLATDLGECVGWNAEGEDVWGFQEPQGRVTAEYEDTEGQPGVFTLEYGAYDGRAVYARFAGSGLVYRSGAAALDALMYPDWDALRPRRVTELTAAELASLSFSLNGHEYEVLRLQEAEDTEAVYSENGWVLDTRRMEAWLLGLGALTREGTAPEPEGRERLFTVTLTPRSAGEEEEAAPAAQTLELWRYDSAHALCVTEGRSLLVEREAAEALAEELSSILAGE